MSDSPEPFWPGSREVEALVSRAVAEGVNPLRAQLTALARALAILADRVHRPPQVEGLASRVDDLCAAVTGAVDQAAARIEAVSQQAVRLSERVGSLEASVRSGLDGRDAQTDDLRKALATAVDEAVTRARATTGAEVARLSERLTSLEASVRAGAEGREAQTDDLRQAMAVAVSHAVAKLDQTRGLEADRLLERIGELEASLRQDDDLRGSVTTAVDQAVDRAVARVEASHAESTEKGAITSDGARIVEQIAALEAARAAEATRVLEQVAALEGPLTRDAIARQAQLDDLRHTVATSIDQAVSRIETARAADASQLLDKITDLVARTARDASRRDEQAVALLSAVDERLQALHVAGAEAGEDREGRLASRLEAITVEHSEVLLSRIDERAAAITELPAIAPMVAAEVQNATAAALGAQVEPLVARLVEAVDSLAHEGGRIEALARSHAGEARAVEERVTAMFVEVAERAESAVDRSRARIAEGQVALGGRFEATVGELMGALNAAAERLEAKLAESVEGLRAAGGHQNGAAIDDLRASQAALREAVQDGAHKAELAAIDIRGLRDRLTPHLVALAEATTRRAEADQAGFDAVLARLDQLLAHHVR